MLEQPLSKSSVVKGVNIKDILEGTFEEEDSSNFSVSLNLLRAAQVGVLSLWDLPLILTVVWPEGRENCQMTESRTVRCKCT